MGCVRGLGPAPVLAAWLCVLVAGLTAGCSRDGVDERLVGRWQPVDVPSAHLTSTFDPGTAVIEFNKDGTWRASDGCNDLDGSYSADASSGDFEADPGGPSAGVGCGDNEVPYDYLLPDVDHVSFHNDGTAVFESGSGEPIMTLTPTT